MSSPGTPSQAWLCLGELPVRWDQTNPKPFPLKGNIIGADAVRCTVNGEQQPGLPADLGTFKLDAI